jgi:dTMP kinase
MTENGLFFTIEGGEGVGKSSFIDLLANRLTELRVDLITTREPGGSPIADRIREIFVSPPKQEPIFPRSELLLVSAARCQHVDTTIRPALAKGQWVLCDRYADSTRVYQCGVGGIDPNMCEQLIEYTTDGLEPALTFLLDCPVEVSGERIQSRSLSLQKSRFDAQQPDFHQRVRDEFLRLSEKYTKRFFTIDATRDIESMVEAALIEIKRRGML